MGARRCCSSHVSPLMPSRKQVKFSSISFWDGQVVSVHLMVFWINEWAVALSCRAISSVLLGVIAVEVGVGPVEYVWVHGSYFGSDGCATDCWVHFVLCACCSCPKARCFCHFPCAVTGPVACDVFDVIKAIKDCELVSEENGPPCMWEWE